MKDIFQNKYIFAPIILGIFFVVGIYVLGQFLYSIRSLDNTISVSGSTREKVISDNGSFIISLEKTVSQNDMQSGYVQIQKKSESLKSFLINQKIAEKDITESALSSFEEYEQNRTEKKYKVSQTITVVSSDVYLVDTVSKLIPLQSDASVVVNLSTVQFFFSKLPDLRISLIQKAILDAQKRAVSLTETTGVKIGKLKSASTGVVQVVPVNSVDISDYGMYDTSTIEKEVVLTVKASFAVK